MTRLQDKAQAMTKQFVGELIGDSKLVEDGKHQAHEAANETTRPPDTGSGTGDDPSKNNDGPK